MSEFEKINGMQNRIHPTSVNVTNETLRRGELTGASFGTMLQEQLEKNNPLQFSKHARERADQRGIELTDDLMDNLASAVSKARAKGARDVVVIDARQAFIVNIPNNTVITTISDAELKENVFTNIDSAVIL